MSEYDDQEPNAAGEAGGDGSSDLENAGSPPERTPSDRGQVAPFCAEDDELRAALPLVLPPPFWEGMDDAAGRAGFRRRAAAFAALTLAVVGLGAATFVVVDRRQQADLLARRAQENAQLAQTVSSLNARLQAVETAKGRDEFAELRRSVGDMKSAAATSRELSAAIAQLTQKVEKLDREQGAKIDKLGDRVDRQTNARTADLAQRLDKLERKPAALPPAPAPATKLGANVSMDPTGSIRPRQVLRGYVVLGAQDDVALIGGRYGERAVRAGDFLPGAGRIERVERQGPNWVVVTDQGVIASAYAAPN